MIRVVLYDHIPVAGERMAITRLPEALLRHNPTSLYFVEIVGSLLRQAEGLPQQSVQSNVGILHVHVRQLEAGTDQQRHLLLPSIIAHSDVRRVHIK